MQKQNHELLEKIGMYKEVVTKLKQDLVNITSEYDSNIKNLISKLEKQKQKEIEQKHWAELVKKFNKKILGYKVKIRKLQENVQNVKDDYQSVLEENDELKKRLCKQLFI